MKRAVLTFLAVLALSISVAGSVATVSDARSNNASVQQSGQHGDGQHNNCDDDRGRQSTPKACNDDDHHDGGHDGDDD